MEILVVRNQKDIDFAYEIFSNATEIGCDTETSSLSARTGKLFSVQFSNGDFNALVPLSERVELGQLVKILENEQITKIFHNAKFDLEFLRENGFQVENVYCTMIAEKILTKGANQSVSLAETLYRYFAVDLDKSQRAKFNKTWNGIWTEELVNYALSDVVYLPKLRQEQTDWLKKLGLEEDFETQMQKIFYQR